MSIEFPAHSEEKPSLFQKLGFVTPLIGHSGGTILYAIAVPIVDAGRESPAGLLQNFA